MHPILLSFVLILNFDTIICIPPFDFYVIKARQNKKTRTYIETETQMSERFGSLKNVPCRCMYESITLNG